MPTIRIEVRKNPVDGMCEVRTIEITEDALLKYAEQEIIDNTDWSAEDILGSELIGVHF